MLSLHCFIYICKYIIQVLHCPVNSIPVTTKRSLGQNNLLKKNPSFLTVYQCQLKLHANFLRTFPFLKYCRVFFFFRCIAILLKQDLINSPTSLRVTNRSCFKSETQLESYYDLVLVRKRSWRVTKMIAMHRKVFRNFDSLS